MQEPVYKVIKAVYVEELGRIAVPPYPGIRPVKRERGKVLRAAVAAALAIVMLSAAVYAYAGGRRSALVDNLNRLGDKYSLGQRIPEGLLMLNTLMRECLHERTQGGLL